MESRHLVSVSRRVSRPIFASLGLEGSKVSGLVSKVSGLETLNITRNWYSKTSIIQRIFICISR